ncbi:MAG TPA: hypothetical protein VNT77_05600 [Allosphingosinicella sp.]|nr:hypothetical protein [Allosphingosinicella sp.]
MLGVALAMFLALFAFSAEILGIQDTTGQMQLSLFASFVFGIVCGYRVRA